LKKFLRQRYKVFEDHLKTLQSEKDLAVLYKEQERYKEAEKYLLEAVKGRRLKLGDNHPHNLESIKNLIALYEAWNKPEEAKKWRAKLPEKELVEE
jgi:tetratricopeptide (TPR) repeat protein